MRGHRRGHAGSSAPTEDNQRLESYRKLRNAIMKMKTYYGYFDKLKHYGIFRIETS